MKKTITIILCIVICISVAPSAALAAGRNTSFEESLASDLKTLGLFMGVSNTDFDLNRPPSRAEALVMLIRVLGKESEALSGNYSHPFKDVAAWSDKYVGYAYANSLSNGVSATEFGGTANANAAMYLTFVLRALGYSDVNGADFTWNNPFSLARTVGILPSFTNIDSFWRADVVVVSYSALSAYLKNSTQTLAQKLISAGVFSQALFNSSYDPDAIKNHVPTVNAELTAEEIYERCSPAVFYVETFNANGTAIGTGSGFFIDSTGIAVTNYHVINGAYSAKITLSDSGTVYDIAGVYDYSADEDWAIIKINGSSFKTLSIGDSSTVVGAATIYAIGSPLGLQNTISQGIISSPKRTEEGVDFIQITAAISPGSSGGALINKYGDVIGITTAQYVNGQNLNLALPISYIAGYSRNSLDLLSDLFPNTGGSGDLGSSVDLPAGGGEVRVEGHSVYKITPNRSDVWVITTSNSGESDPVIILYDDSGMELAYDDDSVGDFNAIIYGYLDEGETYYIEVDFYSSSTSCTLSVSPAQQLPSSGGTVQVDDDTIYTFVPNQSGTWTFQTTSSGSNDPVITIYDDDFYFVGFDDDSGEDYDAMVSVYLEAGKTYVIEIWFYNYDASCSLSVFK